jgi:PBP1b-binding outer membrane lipoprotein LpoB
MKKIVYLIILVFFISGCGTTQKKESSRITDKDMDKELRERKPLPSFSVEDKDPVTSHIEDKTYKGKDDEAE